ncbi:MAG: efflux RND transporter permease subunit [Candidatus Aminicenantia bacterium]
MRLFVERPIATAMFFMTVLALGIYSFLNIPIELAPREEYPRLTISTVWSDVPPEIIQAQVTSPLEEMASTVRGVRKITSSSHIGKSDITLEFDPKTNMEFASLELREKIATSRDKLPPRVNPQIIPYVPEEFRLKPFLSYTISGHYSLQELRQIALQKIRDTLRAVKGVAGVEIRGGSDPEIKIILDENKLRAYNISPYQVYSALSEANKTYSAGKIKKGEQEYIFKVTNVIKGIKDLGEIVVKYAGGNAIKLKDIARVEQSYEEVYSLRRINGQPTIGLEIVKERGTNTLKVARAVKKRLEEIKKGLPSDLIFKVVEDEGEEIQKRLRSLYLLVGIILLVIFIMLFVVIRNLKPSILILSSIAFSVLITFNLIYFFKISINFLTLGGLALGFGLFVDNSIVVFENVWRLREQGFSPREAAIKGSKEVFLPVLASTLTTVSVFFSFAYFQGRLKIYYLPLAIVISSALISSLLVSFSLIPALSPKILPQKRKEGQERFRRYYERFIRFIIKHPIETIIIITLIFYGSYKWFRKEVSFGSFFRWYLKQTLSVRVYMPPGTELEKTDAVIKKFEEKVLEKDYEEEMNTYVYSDRAYLFITFPPEIENSFRPYALKEELISLATNFAGVGISIYGFDPQGYYSSLYTGTYYGSRIKIFGYNYKKLKEITAELEKTLKRNPRIKEVKIVSHRYRWARMDYFEYILKINRKALQKYDLDLNELFYHLTTSLRGRISWQKLKIGGREVNLSLKLSEAEKMDLKTLENLMIRTSTREYLRLREITTIEQRPIAGSIDRENQQYMQTVLWEYRGPYKAAERYQKAIYNSLELPPGFSATMEEEWRMTEEEKGQLVFAIIFSLIIIYMILASLYESLIHPFFILLAVPLALIGVFIAFIIADYPFDSSAYIGVILLGGIVVNNSILLVDHINSKRKQGLDIKEAVVKGARERVRPIFMTAATTVLGMFPLLLIQVEEEGRNIWSSLALSTIGGLMSSTLFILITIPIFYFYGHRVTFWLRKKRSEVKKAWSSF